MRLTALVHPHWGKSHFRCRTHRILARVFLLDSSCSALLQEPFRTVCARSILETLVACFRSVCFGALQRL